MGRLRIPEKVSLIAGLISNDIALFKKAKRVLEKRFGRIDFESAVFNFDSTSYYKDEMGENLKRKFLSFERLAPLKNLYKIKIVTNSIEKRFSKGGRRTINIDPGYLDLSKLVLFSTKDYSHRIYLNKGIFAEATLVYKDRTFNPWPWTYPDYKTRSYIETFNTIREIYKEKI